jgi:L-threonylcarbamoyladenylate synthase
VRLIDLSESETSLKLAVDNALKTLSEGKIMIAPTETAYGLMVDSENQEAMAALFALKNRSFEKVSAIFIKSADDLKRYGVRADMKELKLIDKFWPGPVTFVLKSDMKQWKGILSDKGKIGFRCSSHPLIAAVCASYKKAITATSANLSGGRINSLDQLKTAFSNKVDLFIVDPELDFNSLPSTVVELDGGSIKILREGKVPSILIKEAFANA